MKTETPSQPTPETPLAPFFSGVCGSHMGEPVFYRNLAGGCLICIGKQCMAELKGVHFSAEKKEFKINGM